MHLRVFLCADNGCEEHLMTQDEKDSLVSMLSLPAHWCKEAEARDRSGDAVHFDDPAAVAWDLTGAVCFLFGWERAQELFVQLERHVAGGKRSAQAPNPSISSMVALQEFNDSTETTHDLLLERIRTVPVWFRGPLNRLSVPGTSQASKGDE
jgi:hypothetical protein